MDLDALDEPNQAAAKPSRFAPKSKFQPKSKQPPKPTSETPAPKPEPAPAQDAAPPSPVLVVKKEEESQPLSSAVMDVDGGGDGHPSGTAEPKQEEREIFQMNGDGTEVDEVVEEDHVIAEYDVYFSPSDSDAQLYLLQYPLRPLWRPYELDQRCTEVRLKPNSTELEVDLLIDTDSDNYNPDAPNAAKMKQETLSSQWVPPQVTGYAVGVLMGKKLYVNPIHAVAQLRPSLEYLDSGSKKRTIPDIATKVEGPSRKQSKQTDTEVVESWIPLKYHSSSSELSARCLRKMVAEEDNSLQFPMNPYDYLNSLCPAAAVSKTKPKGPSRRSLLSLPLEERLKTWLIEGPPIQRFNGIKHLAPDDPVEDVLQVLQKYANLIQGLWVAKPAIRYPNSTGPEALARDYVLLKFSESPVIKDSELDVLGSRKSVGKTVLRQIAFERTFCKDWKFRESKDVSFIKLYPDIVEQQEKLWQDRGKHMREKFPQLRAGAKSSAKPEKTGKPGSSTISNQDTVKATNGVRSSRMSKETREALHKVLRKLFQNHKVCSFQTICQGLRDMAVSMSTQPKADARAAVLAASSVDAPHEELHAAIIEIAEYINGVYVLKSSSDHPELNPFRSLVIELYRGTPNAKLKKSEILEAAKIKLGKEPTNNEFQKVITELCVSKGGAWIMKSGDGGPK